MRKPGAENAGSWRGVAKGGAQTSETVEASSADVVREVEVPKKKTRKKKDEVADASATKEETVAVADEVDSKETVSESADKKESL